MVTFNIRTGTYTEHIALSAVTGSDSVNTITIQAESLDSSDVTITYATQNLNDRWTFALFGTSYVTFQHLSFENTAPSVAGACLYLDSANTNTTVQHCVFSGPQTQTYQQHAAAIYATNSFANHHIVVRNCEFTDNEYGVHIRAPYSPSGILNGTSITNCKFTNQFRGAIATSSTIGLMVSNNDITTNSSTAASITVSNCSDTMYVQNNKVVHTNAGRGIYFSAADVAYGLVSTTSSTCRSQALVSRKACSSAARAATGRATCWTL